jgi:hypothetical protein
MATTARAGGQGGQLVGHTTAVDRRAALGGSYGVRGGREVAVGNEVPTAVGAVTRWTSLPAEPRGPNEDRDASRRPP